MSDKSVLDLKFKSIAVINAFIISRIDIPVIRVITDEFEYRKANPKWNCNQNSTTIMRLFGRTY